MSINNTRAPEHNAEGLHLGLLNTDISDEHEQWRTHPEHSETTLVGAFGLYFLLKIPDEESFDGVLSVGITRPMPGESVADRTPDVVLGYTGDSGARLVNLVLEPDEARQLAKLLKKAAKKVER